MSTVIAAFPSELCAQIDLVRPMIEALKVGKMGVTFRQGMSQFLRRLPKGGDLVILLKVSSDGDILVGEVFVRRDGMKLWLQTFESVEGLQTAIQEVFRKEA